MFIPAAVIGIIGAGMLMTTTTYAHGFGFGPGNGIFAQKFAEHFGLNQNDVQSFMQQMHDENQADFQKNFEDRLTQAVADGKITEEQKQTILDFHTKFQEKFDSLKGATLQERRQAMQEFHDEMQKWAEDNNVDIQSFMTGPKFGRRFGMMHGFAK